MGKLDIRTYSLNWLSEMCRTFLNNTKHLARKSISCCSIPALPLIRIFSIWFRMASETLGSRKTFLVSDNPFSNSKTADCSSSEALVSLIGKHSKGDVRTTRRLKTRKFNPVDLESSFILRWGVRCTCTCIHVVTWQQIWKFPNHVLQMKMS